MGTFGFATPLTSRIIGKEPTLCNYPAILSALNYPGTWTPQTLSKIYLSNRERRLCTPYKSYQHKKCDQVWHYL